MIEPVYGSASVEHKLLSYMINTRLSSFRHHPHSLKNAPPPILSVLHFSAALIHVFHRTSRYAPTKVYHSTGNTNRNTSVLLSSFQELNNKSGEYSTDVGGGGKKGLSSPGF